MRIVPHQNRSFAHRNLGFDRLSLPFYGGTLSLSKGVLAFENSRTQSRNLTGLAAWEDDA